MQTWKPIQLVDEKGGLAGVAPSPGAAIKAGSIRLLVRVVLTDGQGRFLLQKRANSVHMYPGCWDTSASGHVDEGETPQEAAHRELTEELSIQNISLVLRTQYYEELRSKLYDYTFKSYSHVFTGLYTGPLENLQLASDEVAAAQWFTRQQIKQMLLVQPKSITDGIIKIFGEDLA